MDGPSGLSKIDELPAKTVPKSAICDASHVVPTCYTTSTLQHRTPHPEATVPKPCPAHLDRESPLRSAHGFANTAAKTVLFRLTPLVGVLARFWPWFWQGFGGELVSFG